MAEQETSTSLSTTLAYISKRELDHALAGFAAIIPPVFFTMLLSAVTVLYVTPDASESFQDDSLLLFKEDSASSGTQAASLGLVNALIIIGAVMGMTFVIVLLLYFNCEKIFALYLVFALIMLMGFTTGLMVVQGLEYYVIPTDIATLGIFFYNYAIVGAIAIFSYEIGLQGNSRLIPYQLAQFYLVIISVVMAWLVTNMFPYYTTWALLVCLALYDLCAVLTPCGPLNLLIKVVTNRQQKDEERRQEERKRNPLAASEDRGNSREKQLIPGLLYEVNTGPSRSQKNKTKKLQAKKAKENKTATVMESNTRVSMSAKNNSVKKSGQSTTGRHTANGPKAGQFKKKPKTEQRKNSGAGAAGLLTFIVMVTDSEDNSVSQPAEDIEVQDNETGLVPPLLPTTTTTTTTTTQETLQPTQNIETETLLEKQYKPPLPKARPSARQPEDEDVESYYDELEQSNLKLGLGDFVFYSVLTAKAAEFGFIAFISVACCVLCGLCGTLVLLSVFQKALPALPISIALGVATYLVVFKFTSPFADDLSLIMVSV